MTANDTAAASYQLRRKDVELMRRAKEALEECRIVVRKYADYIESAGEDIENGEIYRSAGQVIAALEERLRRE